MDLTTTLQKKLQGFNKKSLLAGIILLMTIVLLWGGGEPQVELSSLRISEVNVTG